MAASLLLGSDIVSEPVLLPALLKILITVPIKDCLRILSTLTLHDFALGLADDL